MVVKEFYASMVLVEGFLAKNNLPTRLMTLVNNITKKETPAKADIKDKVYPFIDEVQVLLLDFEAETGFPLEGSDFLGRIGLDNLGRYARKVCWQEGRRGGS